MQLDTQPHISEALERILSRLVGPERVQAAAEVTVVAPWPPNPADSHRVTVDGEVFEVDGITLRNEIYDPEVTNAN